MTAGSDDAASRQSSKSNTLTILASQIVRNRTRAAGETIIAAVETLGEVIDCLDGLYPGFREGVSLLNGDLDLKCFQVFTDSGERLSASDDSVSGCVVLRLDYSIC